MSSTSDSVSTHTADAKTSFVAQTTRAGNPGPGLCDVPSEVLEVVAQYCIPPDVFSLSLTSREFLVETHCQPSPSPPPQGGGSHGLTNKLLHVSMLQSLKRALKRNGASFRPEIDIFNSFTDLANSLPPNSVAMSGSIVVQAVLGVNWEDSDLDVYCISDAAPAVRSWLINNMKQVLVGVHPVYYSEPIQQGEFIGSVEKWMNTPDDGELFKTKYGRTWRFSKSFCSKPSPFVYGHHYQRDHDFRSFDPDETWEVGTMDHATDIPFEPLLLRDEVEKKGNIDLIIANRFYGIGDVIDDFDIEICKCLWDGHKFIIPSPQLTFRKCSALTESREVRQMRTYLERLATESNRSFHSMMTEFRTGGRSKQAVENYWRRFGDESRNRNFLEHFRVIPFNDKRAYDDISLVVDHFDVFSEWLDEDLPVSIAWLINMLRAVLMENVLNSHIEGIEGIRWDPMRSFIHERRPKLRMSERDCLDGAHLAACKAFSAHNFILRSMGRVRKYRRRGIEIEPLLPGVLCGGDKCQCLGRFSRHDSVGSPKFEGGRALTPPEYPHFVIPPPPGSTWAERVTFLYGEDIIDDDEDWGYPSGGPADRFERIAETTRINGEARNQERSKAFRVLVEEARREHIMSLWRAHKASIKTLPPMGIVLPSDEEEEGDVPGCTTGGQEGESRKRKEAGSPRGEGEVMLSL
jgi:hypothetical protein